MESQWRRWHLPRALWGTLVSFLGGALAPLALAWMLGIHQWLWGQGQLASDSFRQDLVDGMAYPAVGCAVICACAGWATFAPAGKHSFAWSLAIIFLISVPLWAAIGWMELTPRRYKGLVHPMYYPSELLALFGPPTVVAMALTLIRIRRLPRPGQLVANEESCAHLSGG